jgi:hypothetical protein
MSQNRMTEHTSLCDVEVWRRRAPLVAHLLSVVRELLEWRLPCTACTNVVASLGNPMCSDVQRGLK